MTTLDFWTLIVSGILSTLLLVISVIWLLSARDAPIIRALQCTVDRLLQDKQEDAHRWVDERDALQRRAERAENWARKTRETNRKLRTENRDLRSLVSAYEADNR